MNTRKTLLSAAIVSCIAFSAHAQQRPRPPPIWTP